MLNLTVYKFQKLEVYRLALEYVDAVYQRSRQLPDSDPEQARFLGLAVRSFLETVACWDLVGRRAYISPNDRSPSRF
jgi:hypothetical protein